MLPPLSAVLLLLLLPVLAAPATASAQTPAHAKAAQSGYDDAEDYVDDDDRGSDPDGAFDDGSGQPAEDQAPPAAPTPFQPLPPAPIPVQPQPAPLFPPLVTTGTVPGRQALMRTDGKAAIPRGAPERVRAIIAAANRIVGKRYKWGGGHARLADSGYDCSGTVSYALIRSGELNAPLVSGSFARWGARGAGSYVTIYANRGHVYMEVAGLRLDTSAVGDPGGRAGVRWRPVDRQAPRLCGAADSGPVGAWPEWQ